MSLADESQRNRVQAGRAILSLLGRESFATEQEEIRATAGAILVGEAVINMHAYLEALSNHG